MRLSHCPHLQLAQHAAQLVAGGGGLRGVLVAHEAADERRALLRAQRVEHAVEYQLRQKQLVCAVELYYFLLLFYRFRGLVSNNTINFIYLRSNPKPRHRGFVFTFD